MYSSMAASASWNSGPSNAAVSPVVIASRAMEAAVSTSPAISSGAVSSTRASSGSTVVPNSSSAAWSCSGVAVSKAASTSTAASQNSAGSALASAALVGAAAVSSPPESSEPQATIVAARTSDAPPMSQRCAAGRPDVLCMFSDLSPRGRRAPADVDGAALRGGGSGGAGGYTAPAHPDVPPAIRHGTSGMGTGPGDGSVPGGAGTVPGVTTGRPVGRVEEIRIFPVKSLAGTALTSADIGAGGLSGDRAATVVDADGRPVRGRDAPVLASLSPADVDADALSEILGRPVRLEPLPPQPGVAPVHLVSRAAVDRAAAGDVPDGCSADDPRANLLLAL